MARHRAIDWERTLAFRHYLWDLGFGVAEAMDTAQRGMGLDWPAALELIRRSLAEAKTRPGVAHRLGRGHRPPRRRPRRHRRRRDPRLRGADRGHRGARRPHHPHGEPRARRGRDAAGRLRPRLRPRALAGARAGDHPLARRDVRSRARGLLGLERPRRPRWRPASAIIAAQRRQGRRHQDLAPVEGEGDRHAPPAARRACACIRATTSTTPS